MRALLALAGAVCIGVAVAVAQAGPIAAAFARAALVDAAVALAAAGVVHPLARLTARDPHARWTLRRGPLLALSIVLAAAALALAWAGLAASGAIVVAYAAGRRAPWTGDALLALVAVPALLGVAFRADAWEESALWTVPVALVTLALVLRALWEHRDARTEPRSPQTRVGSARATSRTMAPLLAGAALAFALGLAREPVQAFAATIATSDARLYALIALAVTLGGLGWALAPRRA